MARLVIFDKDGVILDLQATWLPVRCFWNAFCKLCDVKPDIRQQVACEMHNRSQTRDFTPNDPSNEDPMETYKSIWGAQNDCLSTPEYVFGGFSSQPTFGPHFSTTKESQNVDV